MPAPVQRPSLRPRVSHEDTSGGRKPEGGESTLDPAHKLPDRPGSGAPETHPCAPSLVVPETSRRKPSSSTKKPLCLQGQYDLVPLLDNSPSPCSQERKTGVLLQVARETPVSLPDLCWGKACFPFPPTCPTITQGTCEISPKPCPRGLNALSCGRRKHLLGASKNTPAAPGTGPAHHPGRNFSPPLLTPQGLQQGCWAAGWWAPLLFPALGDPSLHLSPELLSL